MRVLKSLIASTAFILIGSGALAQNIDEDTKCGTIEKIMDAPSPDKQRVREVLSYILQTMQALDRVHGLRSKTEILSHMTVDGRSLVALAVTDRCRSHGGLTLADTAVETYEAIRAMHAGLGLNEPQRKWAQRPIAHRRVRVVVSRPRLALRMTLRRMRDL